MNTAPDIGTARPGGSPSWGPISRMRPAVDARASCAFMAELVGLLGEPPVGREKPTANALAEHLDRLMSDAHRLGAPDTTVEAIMSARALLRLAEAPVVFVVRTEAIH